jgi:isopentenyl-diphosphate delta-isomerase type 1
MQLRQKSRRPVSQPATQLIEPGVDNSADDVIVVDRNDVQIGTAPKLEAHQNGLRHRAISVVIGDRRGRMLLHRRAAGKYHSAGLWTNTCCSHPRPGERVIDAAVRRLAEEMGIVCPLAFMFSMNYRAEVTKSCMSSAVTLVAHPRQTQSKCRIGAGNRSLKSNVMSTSTPKTIRSGSGRSGTNTGIACSSRWTILSYSRKYSRMAEVAT